MQPLFTSNRTDFSLSGPKRASATATQAPSREVRDGERFEASIPGRDHGLMRGPLQGGAQQASPAWLQEVGQQGSHGHKGPCTLEEAMKLRIAELERQRIILEQMRDALGLPKEPAPQPAPQVPPWEIRG